MSLLLMLSFFFFIFIIVIIIIWLLYHHHHHHHYHYYYYFIFILAIIILVWRNCILHHYQSSNFYVILDHLHFSAEQLSLLNPCIFPTFPFFLILNIRGSSWGTTVTIVWHHPCFLSKNIMLCQRCSMPWSSSSSSSSWLQLLFSLLLSLFCFASGDNWEFA